MLTASLLGKWWADAGVHCLVAECVALRGSGGVRLQMSSSRLWKIKSRHQETWLEMSPWGLPS